MTGKLHRRAFLNRISVAVGATAGVMTPVAAQERDGGSQRNTAFQLPQEEHKAGVKPAAKATTTTKGDHRFSSSPENQVDRTPIIERLRKAVQ